MIIIDLMFIAIGIGLIFTGVPAAIILGSMVGLTGIATLRVNVRYKYRTNPSGRARNPIV